jgi:hypothetical protein
VVFSLGGADRILKYDLDELQFQRVKSTATGTEPVSTQRQEEKSVASARDLTPVVQSVVRHYTD